MKSPRFRRRVGPAHLFGAWYSWRSWQIGVDVGGVLVELSAVNSYCIHTERSGGALALRVER